jgi:hypothetical protein
MKGKAAHARTAGLTHDNALLAVTSMCTDSKCSQHVNSQLKMEVLCIAHVQFITRLCCTCSTSAGKPV